MRCVVFRFLGPVHWEEGCAPRRLQADVMLRVAAGPGPIGTADEIAAGVVGQARLMIPFGRLRLTGWLEEVRL